MQKRTFHFEVFSAYFGLLGVPGNWLFNHISSICYKRYRY